MQDKRGVNWGGILIALGALALWVPIMLAMALIATSPAHGQGLPGCCASPAGITYAPSTFWGTGNHGCGTGDTWSPTACAAATPTPNPTPAVTPTPTPTPTPALPITLTRLPYLPWPFSYQYQVPWLQLQPDGSLTISSNGGHYPGESLTPPPLGTASTWPGECKIVVRFPADGSAPQAHLTYCTSRTTSAWETGNYIVPVQTNLAEIQAWGVFTARPVGPIGGDTDRDVQIERITLPTLPGIPTALSPFPARTTVLAQKGVNFSIIGIVDLAGHQLAYVEVLYKTGSWPYLLQRYRVTQYGGLDPDPSFPPVPIGQVAGGGWGPTRIVLASDGRTLLATDAPWPATMACHLWQSTDQGQTWSATGIAIPAPTGSVGIAQCGIAVGPGGQALAPMWGVCQTFWSQDGDDGMDWSNAGDWRPYVWAQEGASLPGNLFTAAVEFPATSVIPPRPNPRPATAQAAAPRATPPAPPTWLPGAIQRPRPPVTP